MSPQPAQPDIETMLGDPDFHQLEGPEQRQLLRNAGMQDRSDQELDSLVSAARAYHGMSPIPPPGTPIGRFLTTAGQAFQALPHAGENILHMIGGPDPTTGETPSEWFHQLPGPADYNRLRQGQIAEELGGLVPGVALGLLTGGVARAPEVWGATKTGAGATWAGLKGLGEAYSTEKTLWPSIATGALFEKLGEHLGIPYGAEVGGVLGASPSLGKGFIQGVRNYLNPIPKAGEAPEPFAPSDVTRRSMGTSIRTRTEPEYGDYSGKIIPRAGLPTEVKPLQEAGPQVQEVFTKGKAKNMPAYTPRSAADEGFTTPRPVVRPNRPMTQAGTQTTAKGGGPVNPVDKLDRTALNATLHREAQDLDIAPVGGLRGAGRDVKVPSGFMDIVAKDKFGKPYRELSDDQLRQMINDRTLHNYKVK